MMNLGIGDDPLLPGDALHDLSLPQSPSPGPPLYTPLRRRCSHVQAQYPSHHPARPRDNGELRPATWDEALDRAAAGFRSAVSKHGPQTFGLFSCSKTTNEMNYLAQKLARTVVGSNNIDSCNRT